MAARAASLRDPSKFFTPWSKEDEAKIKELTELSSTYGLALKATQILVNIVTQTMHVVKEGAIACSYPISTAKNGVGQQEGSEKTPLGLHFISEKFGDGAKPLEIFKSRVSTKEMAVKDGDDERITARILWLTGVVIGINKGKDAEGKVVDSHDRYIYIHGTNRYSEIGKPTSKGCVRMIPEDIIDLYEKLPTGTPVYLYLV